MDGVKGPESCGQASILAELTFLVEPREEDKTNQRQAVSQAKYRGMGQVAGAGAGGRSWRRLKVADGSFACQPGWASGCLGVWSKLGCDAFVRLFVTETNV